MNTFQIEEVCRSDPMIAAHFAGVYARDKLPEFPELGKFYVCNTDKQDNIGSHWIVMFINNFRNEYFDSLADDMVHNEFSNFMNSCYERASVQTQESFSTVCGQYCIFYMSLRVRGFSIKDIVYILNEQDDVSDVFVIGFIKALYGVKY